MGGSAHSSSGGPTALGLVSKIPGLEGVAKVDKLFQQLNFNDGGKKRDGGGGNYEAHASSTSEYYAYAAPSHAPRDAHSTGYGMPDHSHGVGIPGGHLRAEGHYGHSTHGHAYESEDDSDSDDSGEVGAGHGKKKKERKEKRDKERKEKKVRRNVRTIGAMLTITSGEERQG
jgi:hypothetical protein